MDSTAFPEQRKRAIFIPFSVKSLITQVVKAGELFGVETIGEIIIEGRGRIDPSKTDDLPAEFATAGWLTVELVKVEYQGVDLLPIINGLPAAKGLREMLEGQAKAHVLQIYNAKFCR